MQAYVHVLCNFAELFEVTGEVSRKEEHIASAISVTNNAGKSSDDASASASASASPSPPPQDPGTNPLMGRILTLGAHGQLSVGQAVVAEGLYRGALQHLSGPFAKHDPRYSVV
jgi:hypothetical protein